MNHLNSSLLLIPLLIKSLCADGISAYNELKEQYDAHCQKNSDINEHIPVLKQLAQECSSVTEIGIRTMESTWGVLQGLAESQELNKWYVGIDLDRPPETGLSLAQTLSESLGIGFNFVQGNDMDIDIEPTDLLFIDSNHTYIHLSYELEKFSPKVTKYIAMHDTDEPWGFMDEPHPEMDKSKYPRKINRYKHGLWQAVVDFLKIHPEWTLHERRTNNHGFTVLKRKGV